MWLLLKDPYHVEFYGGFITRVYRGVDWKPIIRAVSYVQSISAAQLLHAYTSHYIFNITTAPSYDKRANHHNICIMWRWQEQDFWIHLMPRDAPDIGIVPEETVMFCRESDFPMIIDFFIQRLLDLQSETTLKD